MFPLLLPRSRGLAITLLLVFLLVLRCAATTHRFDTELVPGQHNVLLTFQCDDRVDTQFVDIALEKGISVSFAPYRNFVTDINGDFTGDPYFDEWSIGWARSLGMEFAIHDQPAAPALVDAFGRDTLRTRWDLQTEFVRQWGGITEDDDPGFVWVGHQNRTELRAMAREYGFPWTRGGLARNEDLYLNGHGWGNPGGAAPFCPPIMYHRALVPSCSMYRLNTLGSAYPHAGTVADTTGWWAGTHQFLDELASRGGVAVLNIHPGFTGPRRETVSRDSAYARDLLLPNGNRIHFRGRQGNPGRNDVSALQLDYILEAMAHWDSLKVDTEGVRRLVIMGTNRLLSDERIPWRMDNTADPDVAVANAWRSADSLATPYASYHGDAALVPVAGFPVFVDGTGTVRAGLGTRDLPLPMGALNHLFNCTVVFTGHAPGDTLVLPADLAMRCGNVVFDLQGLVLLAANPALPLMEYMSAASQARYLHDVEWRNGVFDLAGNQSTAGVVLGDAASISVPVLRPSDIRLKGITFRNGADALWLRNVNRAQVDSCFFRSMPGVAGSTHVRGGSGLYAPLVRNSVFDLDGAGSNSFIFDFGNTATDNWEDSLSMVNNILITGTGSHFVIRMPSHTNLDSTTVGRCLRLGGSYVVNNRADGSTLLVSGSPSGDLDDLRESVIRNRPDFGWPAAWLTGPRPGFDWAREPNDTLRFGGWTGPGSKQRGSTASIGPVLYVDPVPDLRIRCIGADVCLEWDPVPGATGYRLYRKEPDQDWLPAGMCFDCSSTLPIGDVAANGRRVALYRVTTVFSELILPDRGSAAVIH